MRLTLLLPPRASSASICFSTSAMTSGGADAPTSLLILKPLSGAGLWLAGRTETRLADVHKELATLQYADAQNDSAAVEQSQSIALERRVPVVGKAAETDARHTRAAAGYWRTDYAAIAPQNDANGVITETDPAIVQAVAKAEADARLTVDGTLPPQHELRQ